MEEPTPFQMPTFNHRNRSRRRSAPIDETVAENATFEVHRPGVLRKTNAYLRQVWKIHRRSRLFARFRRLRQIAKEWSLIRSITIDDRKRLRRRFVAQQRRLVRNDSLFITIVVLFAIMLLVGLAAISQSSMLDNISIINVPLRSILSDWGPQPVPSLMFIILLWVLLAAFWCYSKDVIAISLILFSIAGSFLLYIISWNIWQGGKCLANMDLPNCPLYVSNIIVVPIGCVFGLLVLSIIGRLKTILDEIYPQEIISDNLFRIIVSLERGPSSVESIALRRNLVVRIERVALIAQSRLLSQIPTKESSLAARQKIQADLISRTVIERAIWLLTPTPRTAEDILSYFAKMIVALLDGTWDEFFDKPSEKTEEMAVPEITERAAVSKEEPTTTGWVLAALLRIGALIRGMIAPGVSIGVFYLIQHYQIGGNPIITINEPAQTYIQVGLIVWVIIVIVSTIDPLFAQRVTTLKEIVGTLRGTGAKE